MEQEQLAPPAEVMKFLNGLAYPCNKPDVLEAAKRNHAPEIVLQTVLSTDPQVFQSPRDLERGLQITLDRQIRVAREFRA